MANRLTAASTVPAAEGSGPPAPRNVRTDSTVTNTARAKNAQAITRSATRSRVSGSAAANCLAITAAESTSPPGDQRGSGALARGGPSAHDRPLRSRPRRTALAPDTESGRPGQRALAAGVAAVFGLFVPGIGEFITVPASLAALVLGVVGLRRYERGHARAGPPAVGAILGALALLAALLIALASET